MPVEYIVKATQVIESAKASKRQWGHGLVNHVLGLPLFTVVNDYHSGKFEGVVSDEAFWRHMSDQTVLELVHHYANSGEVEGLTISDIGEDGRVKITRKLRATAPEDYSLICGVDRGRDPELEFVLSVNIPTSAS